jgi:hypothetical protein
VPTTFHDHLHRVATEAVTSIPATEAGDIYALSFFVDYEDPRQSTLTIGYNTQTRVRQILADQPGSELIADAVPIDEAEARWGYAYWLRNRLAVIGDSSTDPVGARLRERWIKDSGLWFDEFGDTRAAMLAILPLQKQIVERFVEACVQLASWLHSDGVIQRVFGRPIPILLYDEYYDPLDDQIEAANPPGVAADFMAWFRSR